MERASTTTAFEISGRRTLKCLGVVMGTTVGRHRAEALQIMIGRAESLGANAVVRVRFDSNQTLDGAIEVVSYGTAMVVE